MGFNNHYRKKSSPWKATFFKGGVKLNRKINVSFSIPLYEQYDISINKFERMSFNENNKLVKIIEKKFKNNITNKITLSDFASQDLGENFFDIFVHLKSSINKMEYFDIHFDLYDDSLLLESWRIENAEATDLDFGRINHRSSEYADMEIKIKYNNLTYVHPVAKWL